MQGMNAAEPTGNSNFSSFMSTFGAVKVGGRNFFRMMQNGENVLLYPGGVREVCQAGLPVLIPCFLSVYA